MNSADDREMRELAQSEIDLLDDKIEHLEFDMRVLLLPKDPRDHKSVILEINVDRKQNRLFSQDYLLIYLRYILHHNWQYRISHSGSCGDPLSTNIIYIEKEGAYHNLKYEHGIHRFVFEGDFQKPLIVDVSVEVIPDAYGEEISIDMNDVVEQVIYCHGAGGMSIVRYEGIRLKHVPTGLSSKVTDEPSFIQRKWRARHILASKLYNASFEQDISVNKLKVIRRYDIENNMVTDYRLPDINFNLSEIKAGGLGQIIDPLVRKEYERLLNEHNL